MDNNMMMQFMQMMMQNQTMMNQMMMQMMAQPQPNPTGMVMTETVPSPQQITEQSNAATTPNLSSLTEIADLKAQIEELKQTIAQLAEENKGLRAAAAADASINTDAIEELALLKKEISLYEADRGEPWEETIAEIAGRSGQDYYDANKERLQLYYSNNEIHDIIADFCDKKNAYEDELKQQQKEAAKEKRQAKKAQMEEFKQNNPEEYERQQQIRKERAEKAKQTREINKATMERLKGEDSQAYEILQAKKAADKERRAANKQRKLEEQAFAKAKESFDDFL